MSTVELPSLNHYEFAKSHICSCILCSRWRRWLQTLKKAEKATKGHAPACKCSLCLLSLAARKSALAAELRLNLWIELGWYAAVENWRQGWENLVWKEIQMPDKWWIVKGQYKPIDYWLEKFESYNAKEILLHNYKQELFGLRDI